MWIAILQWVSRAGLGAVFLYSGTVKIQSPLQFSAALAGYRLFPDSLLLPLATWFPWVEIGLGVLLATGWKTRQAAGAAAALLAVFTVILSVTYFRGIDADCGCFGFGERISPLTLGRDALLLIPAIFLVAMPGHRTAAETELQAR
jgi:uncharacterized membrane protein YphA (DoxX/SURF4 family)